MEETFFVTRTKQTKEMISKDKKIKLKKYFDKDKYVLELKGNKMTLGNSDLQMFKTFALNIDMI